MTRNKRIATYDNEIPGMLRFFDIMGKPVIVCAISEIAFLEYITESDDEKNYGHIVKNPLYFKPYTQGCGCMPADVRTPQEQQWEVHNPNPEPVFNIRGHRCKMHPVDDVPISFREEYLEWAMDNDPDFIKEVLDDE